MSEEQNKAANDEANNPIIPPSATSEYISDSYGDIPNPPTNNGNYGEIAANNGNDGKESWRKPSNIIALFSALISLIVGIFTVRLFYQTEEAVKISSEALADARKKDIAQEKRDRETDYNSRIKDSVIYARDSVRFELTKKDFNERSKRDYVSLELTKKSVDAQFKSIEKIKEQFEIDNVPYLQILDFNFTPPQLNQSVIISYTITNVGKYPAKILRAYTDWDYNFPRFSVLNNRDNLFAPIINKYVINQQKIILNWSSQPIDKGWYGLIAGNELSSFYFYGYFRYENLITKEQKEYRFIIRVYPNIRKVDFEYNESVEVGTPTNRIESIELEDANKEIYEKMKKDQEQKKKKTSPMKQ